MNDDDFSGLVRSGAKHSVSVSERTGNAKTPKNIVTSSEEETKARKLAFEAQEIASLEATKAVTAGVAELSEPEAASDSADKNIQKLSPDTLDKNRQAIASPDAAKANVQTIGSDKPQDNLQRLNSDKGSAPNRQGLPTEAVVDNQQGLSGNHISANRQTMASSANTPNVQDIPTDGIAANVQPLANDDTPANRQTLGQQPPAKNVQGIPTNASASNEQKIATLGAQDNHQSIGQPPAIAPNNLTIDAADPSLNRQAAPQDAPPSPNRQAVDNGKIQSHFEALPSGNMARKKVDFSTGDTPHSHATPAANAVAANASRNPAAKLAPASRVPMTATEVEDAKRQREKFSEAFHGRLAGIKHNVEELNDRLTDFEDKVQKEDAKLIKGDPNDFKVDLD